MTDASRVSVCVDPCLWAASSISIPISSLSNRSNKESIFSFVADDSYRLVRRVLRQVDWVIPRAVPGMHSSITG